MPAQAFNISRVMRLDADLMRSVHPQGFSVETMR